jgi:hypothetical protein
MIGIFGNKMGKEENLTSDKTREVTIFLINPTADGLVGDVVEGHALDNHGSREETRENVLHFLHGFPGIHLWRGGFVSKALPCWNTGLKKKKRRLNILEIIQDQDKQN